MPVNYQGEAGSRGIKGEAGRSGKRVRSLFGVSMNLHQREALSFSEHIYDGTDVKAAFIGSCRGFKAWTAPWDLQAAMA